MYCSDSGLMQSASHYFAAYRPPQWSYEKKTVDELYDAQPSKYARAINTDRCPLGLEKGDVLYTGRETGWCGEKLPAGTRVVFTRYMYDHYFASYVPIKQSAFFRFPDGTERSLSLEVIEKSLLRCKIKKLAKLTKKLTLLASDVRSQCKELIECQSLRGSKPSSKA